jgi:protein O-mannosyl-transferase
MNVEDGTRRTRLATCLALVALSIAAHARILDNGFVNYDDPTYVTDNDRVRAGLTPSSVRWAFTSPQEGNWHPVTMLTHMADVELWGLHPAGHHLTSLLLHAANAAVLFLLLSRLGIDLRRAGLAAALFAVHPLNAESVAWIAERKNVLSTLFWMLALLRWTAYVRRPAPKRYLAALALGLLALASKPMAVTLPLTLLLVDVLVIERRVRPGEAWPALALRLAVEKVPFFIASFACGIATIWAQATQGAIRTAETFPLGIRLANAAVSCAWYLVKMVWPTGLSVFYPHPGAGVAAWRIGASLLLLALVTALAVKAGRWFSAAWVWYVVTLLPVLGLVQVGIQARADRYAYVPLIGPLAALAFAMPPWRSRFTRAQRATGAALGLAAIVGLGSLTWAQEGYWKDSVALFERSVSLNPDDPVGRGNLGMAWVDLGNLHRALPHFRRAVELAPGNASGRMNLGNALAMMGRFEEAIAEYQEASRLAPEDPRVRYDLGRTLLRAGRPGAALGPLREAIRLAPGHARAHAALGSALAAEGRIEEARREAEDSLRLAPADPAVRAEARRLAR